MDDRLTKVLKLVAIAMVAGFLGWALYDKLFVALRKTGIAIKTKSEFLLDTPMIGRAMQALRGAGEDEILAVFESQRLGKPVPLPLEERRHPIGPLGRTGADSERLHPFGHRVPHAHPRVERRHRILENDLHPLAKWQQLPVTEATDFFSIEFHRPGCRL